MSDDGIYEIFHLVIEYGGEWDEPSKSGYRVSQYKGGYCFALTMPVNISFAELLGLIDTRIDDERELDDLTKDYTSEKEFEIKEEDVDNVDEEVGRWTRKELMRQFENNEFEDLTNDSFFDNVNAEEDYHSNHTSQNGDDVPTMDHIEDHEGFVDNRDFVMASSNLYEKEDHEDEKPFVPPQAPESMLTIGMEWPNIYECRSFMRNFAIIQRFTFRQKKNEKYGDMEKIMGSYDKGYALCLELCVKIQKSNPGSIASCSMEDGNLKFTNICISFKEALDGFTKGCRPILGLDGYFLKGKYGGQCLSIISLEVNNGLFPITVFICRSECQVPWIKFLTLVQGQLTLHPSKLTFISDRQKGLVEAVLQVFPHSNHRFYFRYMYTNFKQLCRGVTELDANTWLEREPYESWCRSFFDASTKCEHVTNNFSESFNNWIVKIRDKPLNKMVERLDLMKITLMYERKLRAKEWDQNGLITGSPCVQAVKVIDKLKYEWVGHYHRVAAYVATYNQAVNPIVDSSEWGKYTFTLMKQPTRENRPPPLLRPAGRPRTLRRREADEVNYVVR
ncbi:hypothetical protein GIB67_023572 [Kingdonia uniflora]|uniref:MULE transposase domain-containing protein n=1 Tax=Kingdonia uniflora TaxID=39325 RepID=A0A7J7PA18_9MAGN|nr:hypothetical protein GIB67_023572 [Kingdonia uniflora]